MSDVRDMSLRLNDVLEMVGVTEEMRRFHQRRATTDELLNMIPMKRNLGELHTGNCYMCGSSWEGTVTPDLASDTDLIGCSSEPRVVPHRHMAGSGEFLVMVRDDWTRPGYVKLQMMRDGRPLTANDVAARYDVGFDGEGRACVKDIRYGTMHGPATMAVDEHGKHISDTVYAYQCKDIPLFAADWVTRPRQFEWPSQQLIDELKISGCLFVGVGHFESRDKELEWRISFSLQERMLMKSLNITQHRVYVILKMIRKDILEKHIQEESLSSYHCKTCVFYMAETTPASMWVPENIIACLLQCLTLLLRWIKDKFCPSFFLKDSNLFDKEGFLGLVDHLEVLIASLLQRGCKFLYLLQSDRVGDMLRGGDLMFYKTVADSSIDKYIFDRDKLTVLDIIGVFRRHIVKPFNPTEQDSLLLYTTKLETIHHGENYPGYTEAEYRAVVRLVLPWLHLSIGLENAARAVTRPEMHLDKESMKKAHYHLDQARNTDPVNVSLAQATILLRLEKLEECFLFLQELEQCWKYPETPETSDFQVKIAINGDLHTELDCWNLWTYRAITACPCVSRGKITANSEQQLLEIAAECREMPLNKQMRERYISCVIFDRSQIELLPHPLRYEMYRSLFTQPGSRNQVGDAWFDMAVIDAKVYFYLLQYVVCLKLNKRRQRVMARFNLACLAHSEDKVLNHRDTAFNLLGWVNLQGRNITEAMECFRRSWQIRPHHNAAKFHVLDMCYKMALAQQ